MHHEAPMIRPVFTERAKSGGLKRAVLGVTCSLVSIGVIFAVCYILESFKTQILRRNPAAATKKDDKKKDGKTAAKQDSKKKDDKKKPDPKKPAAKKEAPKNAAKPPTSAKNAKGDSGHTTQRGASGTTKTSR